MKYSTFTQFCCENLAQYVKKKRFTNNRPKLYNYFLNYEQLRRNYNEDKVNQKLFNILG